MTYLDTSALVKRFVAEPGTEAIRRLFASGESIATSKIAYAEIYAALARRRREDDLTPRAFARACSQFERDWTGYVRVAVHDDVLATARKLLLRHPLKGYEAIHLASALLLQDALGADLLFGAADDRLLRAAQAERIRIFNPERA